MKKTLGIVTYRRSMAEFYGDIFRELVHGQVEICVGAVEDSSYRGLPAADLYISSVTSYDLLHDNEARAFLNALHPIRMDVTFSRAAVDLLRTYPEGTKAVLVNQNKHMVMECIAQLYHLGISNIEFYPCYPGIEPVPAAGLTITVGEPDLVPPSAGRAVDIGSRLPSANVICETALRLGNAFFLETSHFKKYKNRLASIDYSLETISSKNLTAENRLEIILNALEEGIVCVNERGEIDLINKTARRMLGVERSETLGRPVAEALPELPFDSGEAGFAGPRLLNIRGTDLGAMLVPLTLEERTLGSFMTLQSFRETEQQQSSLRRQKSRKSDRAEHRFEDIVGSSAAISRARDIARRMARNNASILIQGESGTGKSIFAQAIHNASPRASEPFVPVNCAALSDELLEAELFGSADRTPGGRSGLIECAHGGTLYLESLEHMSPRLQASLLRMLEDKEITRRGADEPIPIDVRIISSTSENLLERVKEGSFLRELYYRLSVILLDVPALRERRTDIPQLIDCFRRRADADFELTTRAKLALLQHGWEGNVLELENCVAYLSYTGLRTVDLDDLPPLIRVTREQADKREELERRSGMKTPEYLVLRELGECYQSQKGLGRLAIVERCTARGELISEHETRLALGRLSELGYAEVRSGRGGSRLTEKGYLHYRRLLYGDERELGAW